MSRNFRSRHLLILTVVLAFIVAACGNGGEGTTTTTGGGDTTTTEGGMTTTTEGGGGPEDDPLGVWEIAPGEAIQIRALQSQTGDAGPLGIDQIRGVQLAIADFGPVAGEWEVDLGTPEDDLCNAEGGQAGAQAIVAQENVIAVIGTTCSGAAYAAAPVITGANMVMFSGSNTAPNLTSDLQGNAGEQHFEGYYRTAHNDLFQGAAVASFVFNDLGLTRAVAIHDGDPYTEGLVDAFIAAFETLGGEVPLKTATTGQQGQDQTALLSEVAAAEPEVVFFPIFPQTGGPEIIQQKDGVAGLEDVIWIGADGLFVNSFITIPQSVGMYFSGPDLDFGGNTSATGKTYQEMVDAYVAEFGEEPTAPFHAHTYDATVLVLTAIQEVGVVGDDGVLRIGKQALRDYLNNVSDFDGLIGKITCDEFGDCGSQRVQVAHHDDAAVDNIADVEVVAQYARADLIDLITGG
ncbi:MAG TPA: branched-chain amino acid ABC transporter substrate-binding protein [Acidimicrobiia bacterium]